MRRILPLNLLILGGLVGIVFSGCKPEDVDKAKREATSKAVEVRDATTQKAAEVKEKVEPYIEKGVEKARELKTAATQKAADLKEDAQPYIDKAKSATTRAVEKVKDATTQAVDKIRGD